MARSRQGTFCAPETIVPRQGTFRLPDSDHKTTESESEYKDAEEGPSRARTHISSSSPEPDTEEGPSGARTQHRNNSPEPERVGQPLVERTDQRKSPFDTNKPEPDTDKDLSALFSVKGWNPFKPRPEPFNPFRLHRPPTPPPLPPTPKPMTDVIMNDNDSKIKEVKLNPPKPFDGKRENLRKFVQDGELYLMINKKIYDDDLKKIGFFLSFMNEGDAASWKE